jgi:hypothetical protein
LTDIILNPLYFCLSVPIKKWINRFNAHH